jgi:ElaB/YqjD/DUF883 family membrane-anchored ribosome-binding protein
MLISRQAQASDIAIFKCEMTIKRIQELRYTLCKDYTSLFVINNKESVMSATATTPSRDKAQDFASRAYSQVKETVQDAASAASNMAGQATDKVKEMASDATHKVKEYASIASEKASEVGHEATELVRKYPITSILTVFGIGYLIGRFVRR